MGLADLIACFIREALEEAGGEAELQRSALAQQFHCVPSQINYVLTTRFSPEKGYLVESRRGGGGYIKVIQVSKDSEIFFMHAINGIGDTIDGPSVRAVLTNLHAEGVLTKGEKDLVEAGVSEAALRSAPEELRAGLRASILKQMLLQITCRQKERQTK